MIIGYLSKREADERRHRWAEKALDRLAQHRPVDAARLSREWKEIILAEQEGEDSYRRYQESWIALIKVTFVTTIIAGIAALIWGPSEYFFLIIPSWIVVIPLWSWLGDKFKKKQNRRSYVPENKSDHPSSPPRSF